MTGQPFALSLIFGTSVVSLMVCSCGSLVRLVRLVQSLDVAWQSGHQPQ
jgi:hypothetical protein